MKIVRLSAENVLRLNAVEITPEGNLVVIGGRNEQGKTSVLDSIVLALGGRQAGHAEPLKQGAKKGEIVCELDNIIVRRSFTRAGGGTLTVSAKDGVEHKSPQKLLDKLVGSLSFDPLKFSSMHVQEQVSALKKIVGLDFSFMDREREAYYDQRRDVNRDVKRLQAELDSTPDPGDIKPVPVNELMVELEKIQKENRTVEQAKRDVVACRKDIVRERENTRKLKQALSEAQEKEGDLRGKLAELEAKVGEPVDEGPIKQKIEEATEANAQAHNKERREELAAELTKTRRQADLCTENINQIDDHKTEQLAAAEFPVEGLSFNESGVLLNGVPFKQSSSAERLKVSVAMGIAMNPELKVLLVRDGSLLDDDHLKMVAEMAEESDAQVWLERVSEGEECQVIISDGKVVKEEGINE